MEKGKTNQYFKAYVNKRDYKIFMDDVALIFKVALRDTPRLQPEW